MLWSGPLHWGSLVDDAVKDARIEDIADRAIARMRSPRDMHIICVDVTNKCDLHCSNCTRLLKNQTELWDMTPDNFRMALRSFKGFTGVIAMIGGNPCISKHFPELCRIFAEEVPNKRQRGLWSNNVFEFQELVRDTFGFFNLNPHGDERGRKSLEKLKALVPQAKFFVGHSHHAPLLAAMRDMYPDAAEMWNLIPSCDINQQWSATIVQNKGELRAYFCEVAASFDLARQEDNGFPVTEGWWNRSITDYARQVKHFCPGCGVPARLKGNLDIEQTDTYSPCNAKIAENSLRKKRKIIEVKSLKDAERLSNAVTNYNAHHDSVEHGVVQQDGMVAAVYAKDGRYYCMPRGENADGGAALARLQARALPDYVARVIHPDDSVLYVGPGFSPNIVDIARKAREVVALEPNNAAVENLTLTCRLNACANTRIERLAAYDHNAVADFAPAADPADGLIEAGESGHEMTEHVACVRIDDYFAGAGAIILATGGPGDMAALAGAAKTLAQARLLFVTFNCAYYAQHPAKLTQLIAALEKAFKHCYAPHIEIKDSGDGFTSTFAHLMGSGKSGCITLAKDVLH